MGAAVVATYEILKREEVVAVSNAPTPKLAMKEFAIDRDWLGAPGVSLHSTPTQASLSVVGHGLFKTRRVRSTEEQVRDAEKRAASARGIGDEATAEAWERERERRSHGDHS
jgi:hypothetical protein